MLGIREDDVCLSTTKLFHAYGFGNCLSFPFWVGATAVQLRGRPIPDRVFEAVERFRPTLFFSVPTLYNAMLRSPGAERRDLSSVRLCVSAAESLPADIWRRWHDAYGLTILDGIGSTEMLHIFCSNTLSELQPGSSGKPVPGYELKLLDEQLASTPPGETGNLYVRGDSALAFYWRQHEKTKQTVLGDWIYTGDRYRQDADGFWWHQGRADDMLKVGGNWVSPVEMEQTLGEHDAVDECAVVQVLVEGLTRIKAVVVTSHADREQLTPSCRRGASSGCSATSTRTSSSTSTSSPRPPPARSSATSCARPPPGRAHDRRPAPDRRAPARGPPADAEAPRPTWAPFADAGVLGELYDEAGRSAPTASTPSWRPRASTWPC